MSQKLGIRQGQLRERPYVVAHASAVDSSFRSQSIRASRQELTPSTGGATSCTLGLGHVCAALDIDPGDKAGLVARVEDLKRRMSRVESPNRVGVVRESVQASLRSEGPELDRGCAGMREMVD